MNKARNIWKATVCVLTLVLFLFPIIAIAKVSVWDQTDFWFRDDDGTEISATGYGSPDITEDTNITDIALGAAMRLRFGVRVTDEDGVLIPQLEFKQGTDCTTGNWTSITPTSDMFSLQMSGNFDDGDPTTKQISGGSFVAGKIFESTNPAPSLDLPKNKNTEYEWSIKTASDIPLDTIYSFRITNSGSALNNYDVCPTLTTTTVTPTPTPSVTPTPSTTPTPSVSPVPGGKRVHITVRFSGKAFPSAKIFVVDKTTQQGMYFETVVSRDIIADTEGTFQVDFVGIAKASHSFGLLIKDKENRTTQTKFFNIDTSDNDLVVKDILVPPTVGFQRRLVSRGQPIIVIGNASPNNTVILEIDGIMKKEANAGKDGSYTATADTGTLEFGTHSVRVRQVDTGQKRESDYSLTNTFTVSRLTLPRIDLNNDGTVNIEDWSIFLSNWGIKDENRKKTIDLNDDGQINISDFSIFIRAIKR